MTRYLLAAGVCALVGLAIFLSESPTEAQGGKDDLKKQIQKLQQQLKDKEQHIQKLETQIQKLKLNDVKDDGKIALLQQRIKQLEADAKKKSPTQIKKDLDAANLSLKEKDQLIATLQQKAPKATADLSKEVEKLRKSVKDLEAVKNAPFVHSLILKMKRNDDEQVKLITTEADKTLAKIEGVRGVWIGKPAEKGTPELAQKNYQIGVVVLLDDADALKKFLEDPLHKQFTDKIADYWELPVVYDIQREPEMKNDK